METPKEPESFQCPQCGEYQAVDDKNAFLVLFITPEHAKYSFLAFHCNAGCEKQPFFVDIEDAVKLGYLEHVEVYEEAPQKVVDEWKKVYEPEPEPTPEAITQALANAALELQFHNWIEIYNPAPEEFDDRRRTL